MLFRYLGSHVFETLDKTRLKVSRVRDLNDPFEFLYSPRRRTSTADEIVSQIHNRLEDPSSELRAVFPPTARINFGKG